MKKLVVEVPRLPKGWGVTEANLIADALKTWPGGRVRVKSAARVAAGARNLLKRKDRAASLKPRTKRAA
jgi:hypothetical protein